MARQDSWQRAREACFFFLILWRPAQASITTVSLSVNYPHGCVSVCLLGDGFEASMGGVMGCASPWANDCYCATGAKAASIATSFASSCASAHCASGDLSDDLSVLEMTYASYCLANGFTQPGMTDWFNPAAATSSGGGGTGSDSGATASTAASNASPATTTQITLVTQTTTTQPAANGGGGSNTSPTLVTVHKTSTTTILVNSAGSTLPAASHSSGTNTVALGAGLGVGLGIALIAALVIILWLVRRRRPDRGAGAADETMHQPNDTFAPFPPDRQEMAQPPNTQLQNTPPLFNSISPVHRKPVGGPPTSPRESIVSPVSHNPSPGFGVAGNELSGQDARTEMSGQGQTPELPVRSGTVSPHPPAYSTPSEYGQEQTWATSQGGRDPRWELP